MSELYKLEKWIWSEKDFEKMGWHDCHIHSLAFYPEKFELALDLDYIFKWVEPKKGETHYKFWVAPVTMVFENVYDISINIETSLGIEIASISRSNQSAPRNVEFINKVEQWDWNIDCQEGTIFFKSVGYTMYVKSEPIFLSNQVIDINDRGGINFERGKLK